MILTTRQTYKKEAPDQHHRVLLFMKSFGNTNYNEKEPSVPSAV